TTGLPLPPGITSAGSGTRLGPGGRWSGGPAWPSATAACCNTSGSCRRSRNAPRARATPPKAGRLRPLVLCPAVDRLTDLCGPLPEFGGLRRPAHGLHEGGQLQVAPGQVLALLPVVGGLGHQLLQEGHGLAERRLRLGQPARKPVQFTQPVEAYG